MSKEINWMEGNLGRRAPKKLEFSHLHIKKCPKMWLGIV